MEKWHLCHRIPRPTFFFHFPTDVAIGGLTFAFCFVFNSTIFGRCNLLNNLDKFVIGRNGKNR